MHPTVQKALNGETVTAAEIQAMGGYQVFDNAIKQAQKPIKPQKVQSQRSSSRAKPEYNYTPTDARLWWMFQMVGFVIGVPMFLLFACS